MNDNNKALNVVSFQTDQDRQCQVDQIEVGMKFQSKSPHLVSLFDRHCVSLVEQSKSQLDLCTNIRQISLITGNLFSD